MLGLTIFAPFFITSPASMYPPSILQAAATRPTEKITSPFKRKITSDVMFDVRFITFACAFAVLMLIFAKIVNAIIKNVPVPGP